MKFEYEGFGSGLGLEDLREIPLPLRQQGFKDCAVPRQFWNWLFKHHDDTVVEMVKSRLQFVPTDYDPTYDFVADTRTRLVFIKDALDESDASRYNYRYLGGAIGQVTTAGTVRKIRVAEDAVLVAVNEGPFGFEQSRVLQGETWSSLGNGTIDYCYQPDFSSYKYSRLRSNPASITASQNLTSAQLSWSAGGLNTNGTEGLIRSYEGSIVAFGSDSGVNWCRELRNPIGNLQIIAQRPCPATGRVQAARFRGRLYVNHITGVDQTVNMYDIPPTEGDASGANPVDWFTVPLGDEQPGFQISENLMVFTFENGNNYTHRVFFSTDFWIDIRLDYQVQLTGDRLWYNTGEAWYATRPLA